MNAAVVALGTCCISSSNTVLLGVCHFAHGCATFYDLYI